jgi:hypothetical protein
MNLIVALRLHLTQLELIRKILKPLSMRMKNKKDRKKMCKSFAKIQKDRLNYNIQRKLHRERLKVIL